MLSSDVPKTPRPLPPAKARRRSSSRGQLGLGVAPPPYAPFASIDAHALPTLLGSPISATSRLIRLDDDALCGGSIQERSKEELEELLRRAGSVIREREQELDLTSETCRALVENNAALKTRNDTLIARLPTSQPSSPLMSPRISSNSSYGRLSPSPSFSPPHSRSASRSLPLSPSLHPRRAGAHARRVSSTPAELAVLADQNAELLSKLADLEAEASRAEQAGKRRLKSLEAEIEGLRDELEKTRAEHVEGAISRESEGGKPAGLDSQLVKMYKKLGREAKVRELKAKTRPWDSEQGESENLDEQEPKDFAPSNLTPGLPFTAKWVSRNPSSLSLSLETSPDSDPFLNPDQSSNQVDSPQSSLPPSATSTIGPSPGLGPGAREQALVSQLLLKIHELEETNAQLASHHAEASVRLRAAQSESESVRRLCEFISDEVDGEFEVEVEVGGDVFDFEELRDEDPSALKGKSLRLKSIGQKASMDFGSGSRRSSVRLRKFRSMDNIPPLDVAKPLGDRAPKTRKTVLGLFEEEPTSSSTPSHYAASINDYSKLQDSPSFAPDSSFESERPVDLDRNPEEEEDRAERMPSLGSELGLQLQDLPPAPAHARSKSIMELLLMDAGSPLGTIASSTSTSTSTSNMKKALKEDEHFPMDKRITHPRLRRAKDGDASPLTPTSMTKSPLFSYPTQSPLAASASSPRTLGAHPGPSSQRQPQNKLDKLQTLLIELWLWMHFAAVIAVFIFTMARMGPKVFFDTPGAPPRARKNR